MNFLSATISPLLAVLARICRVDTGDQLRLFESRVGKANPDAVDSWLSGELDPAAKRPALRLRQQIAMISSTYQSHVRQSLD